MRRRTIPVVLLLAALVSNLQTCSRRPDIEWVAQGESVQPNQRNLQQATSLSVPSADRRGEDQTFLTIPEWFLVFSSAEYADALSTKEPSTFPFIEHIGQFWSSYGNAWMQTRVRYPFNPGYHLMEMVIGVSTSIEYGLKSIWESTIGLLTEVSAGINSREDEIARATARDYQSFIRREPWYLFDFWKPLRDVLTAPISGVRSLERKYILSTEYCLKGLYATLLTWATSAVYGEAGMTTVCLLEDDSTCVTLPRYEGFMVAADSLAACGRSFREIAGVRGEIVVSAIAPRPLTPSPRNSRILYEQPILTRVPQTRVVFAVNVAELSQALRTLRDRGWVLEHIYDY